MAGFGGSVKLTGEAAYRQALQAIAADLKNVAAQQKLTAASYDKTDTSLTALSKKSEDLKSKLSAQQKQYDTLSRALKDYTSQQEKAKNTIQNVQAQLDKEKSKLEQIAAQYGKQSQEYKNQAKVVDELEQQLKELNAQYDKNETTIKKTQAALTSSEADIKKTKAQMQDLGEKAQKAGQDANSLGLAVENSGKQAKSAADDGYTVFKNVLANLATQVITKTIEGVKRLGTALIDVGKQSLASYAQYEQLVGGVETLFKNSANEVQKYAAVAYKTAGMSANEYMSTVTSFSASLLQGLGGDTAKAAKIADMAIIDMSDNANKMGTSMEMIQNAYQGFAKQNFTMLDNLKLGYGGTQAEMARLINETGVMGKAFKATAKNVKEVPFDKMIEAIHKVQQNMGITGTTAVEASETVEGSVNSMKASWSNLLTAIADDNADMGKSVDEFVDSTATAAKNVIPRIRQIVDGIKKLIGSLTTDVFPKLKREIPELNAIIVPFEWLLNNYKLVVGGIQAIVAAFAVKKVADFTKSMSDAASHLLSLTGLTKTAASATTGLATAQGAATTATNLGTAAAKLFNAAWAANPIGVVVGGIALLAGGIIAVTNALGGHNSEMSETDKHLRESKKLLKENTESWDALSKAQQENVNKGMTEMSYYQSLADELSDIVDANGKVKSGYEDRAAFITSTLKEALGIEISMTDGVIQGYAGIEKSIQDTIAAKKAKVQLDAQEALYTEALEKQGEVIATITNLERDKAAAVAESESTFQRYTDAILAGNDAEAQIHLQAWQRSEDRKNKIESDLGKQEEMYSMYAYNIGQYEDNMAKYSQGKYDEMTNIVWEHAKEFQSAEEAQRSELETSIANAETQLKLLNKIYQDTGDERIKDQAVNAEKTLNNLRSQMAQYNTTTETSLRSNLELWDSNLDAAVSKITGANVEFRDAGDGNVQMFVNGVASGKPKSKSEMRTIVEQTIAEVNKQKGSADSAGQNLISGVNSGISNQNQQSSAFRSISNFGNNLLSRLRASLQEHSPSKATREMGQFLLRGLGIGIKKEEDTVLEQVEGFGENVLGSLSSALDAGVSTNALQALQTAIPTEFDANISTNTSRMAEAAQTADKSLVGYFKQALSEMKIEMDGYEMGNFVDKTVTKLVYN